MEEETDQCKLFVGGVSRETTEQILREHFGKYGTVSHVVIARDRVTGNPRGFAFVSFANQSAVTQVLQVQTHDILGRMVDVKRAIPRGEQWQSELDQSRGLNRNTRSNGNGRNNEQFRTKKIFVGGLSANVTQEEFRNYFEQFGKVTDVVVMHDSITRRPRGFGFITFESEDSVEDVMMKSFHELGGKQAEVKRAVPKEVNNNRYYGQGGGGRGHNENVPPYSPTYDLYHSSRHLSRNGTLPGYGGIIGYPYGVFGVGFPAGYGGVGYVFPPWGVTGNPFPYAGAANYYFAYPNGGVGGMGVAVNQVGDAQVAIDGGNTDNHSLASSALTV